MEQELFIDQLTTILFAFRVRLAEEGNLNLKEGKLKEENPEKINQEEEDITIKSLL